MGFHKKSPFDLLEKKIMSSAPEKGNVPDLHTSGSHLTYGTKDLAYGAAFATKTLRPSRLPDLD